MSSSKT